MIDRRAMMVTTMAMLVSNGRARSGTAETFWAPAEEAPHARTWMAWPSTKWIYGASTGYYESVQETVGRLAAAIAENEPVTMLAGVEHHETARQVCGPRVDLLDIPTDDMWARDSGPIFLKASDGRRAILDLNFNGWGGKQAHRQDAEIPKTIAGTLGRPYVVADIVGEGGGLEFDGDGTLLLTDSCWINDNRNPGMTKGDIEAELKRRLGVTKVIWLPGVRGQDITDGHIDGSVRIVRPGLIMTSGYPGDTSDWSVTLQESKEILSRTTDARGRSFEIVEIPHAVDVRSSWANFFSGYSNFYIGNGAVYTPEFGDKNADRRAVEGLGNLFPGRKIVALNVDRIYENGGGIHCVTQQEPA